jgi:hypothetical protein
VLPEVPQVGADRVRVAVDDLGREFEAMELLVPELPLRVRAEDPLADAGQRGEITRARTRSGRSAARVWAMRLPTS